MSDTSATDIATIRPAADPRTVPTHGALTPRPTSTVVGRASATVSVHGQTVVDPPTRRAGEGVAERPPSPSTARRWSIRRRAAPAKGWQSGHRLRPRPDGGRSADAPRRRRGGRAATVSVHGQTVVDPPTRRAGEGVAERPP